MQIADVGRAKL